MASTRGTSHVALDTQQASQAEDVELPFDIPDTDDELSPSDGDILVSIFPGTIMVGRGRSYLQFYVERLPDKPWPLLIGGLPWVIRDANHNGKGMLFPLFPPGNPFEELCHHLDVHQSRFLDSNDKNLREIGDAMTAYIQQHALPATLDHFFLTTDLRWYFVLSDDSNLDQAIMDLPGVVAQSAALYLLSSTLPAPVADGQQADYRAIAPSTRALECARGLVRVREDEQTAHRSADILAASHHWRRSDFFWYGQPADNSSLPYLADGTTSDTPGGTAVLFFDKDHPFHGFTTSRPSGEIARIGQA